ncbi:MAG: hypothetical protein U1E34_00695 [Amaricoccus sp.]
MEYVKTAEDMEAWEAGVAAGSDKTTAMINHAINKGLDRYHSEGLVGSGIAKSIVAEWLLELQRGWGRAETFGAAQALADNLLRLVLLHDPEFAAMTEQAEAERRAMH